MEGLGLNAPCDTLLPDNGMFKLELEAFEVRTILPLMVPAAVGANFTVKEELCPAFSVRGSVSPLRLIPLPVTEAAEMVTEEPPVLLRVSARLALLPTCTLPKARADGLGLRVP